MKELPEYEWTESGMLLLANLYAMIEQTGSSGGLAHYIVAENPEYFRNWIYHKSAEKYFRNRARYNPPQRRNYHWSKSDIDLIIANMDKSTHLLCKLFPSRTWRAIANMRYAIQRGVVGKAV